MKISWYYVSRKIQPKTSQKETRRARDEIQKKVLVACEEIPRCPTITIIKTNT